MPGWIARINGGYGHKGTPSQPGGNAEGAGQSRRGAMIAGRRRPRFCFSYFKLN